MRTSTNRRKFLGLTTGAAASTWAGAGLFAAGASAACGPNGSMGGETRGVIRRCSFRQAC